MRTKFGTLGVRVDHTSTDGECAEKRVVGWAMLTDHPFDCDRHAIDKTRGRVQSERHTELLAATKLRALPD
eukprot:SAG11_NODE_33045_length_279_cov_0.866667_1_plen_71_part_00